ncbi:MAG: orotidine-5'-phosphate decarboxylase [Eubacteriales bacterium]|nr:orotidine-5'-phosphate decarboxylase [Eubacteriales bacterium]
MLSFADRLTRRVQELHNPSLLGLDPNLSYLPKHLLLAAAQAGKTGPDLVAAAFLAFNQAILEEVRDIIGAVKFQSACYEQYGAAGEACLRESINYAKSLGYITILDAKRNDIGSTAAAYARASIGESPLGDLGGPEPSYRALDADAVTLNGYLGIDGIQPFLEVCQKEGKGVFILVRTSNPSAGDLQDLDLADGRKLYEAMADLVAKWGEGLDAGQEFSSVGAVVGATWPAQARALRERMPRQIFLIPGYGAQGASAQDALAGFREGRGGIINASRSLMLAWQKEASSGQDFAQATRRAALRMQEDLLAAL